MGSSASPPLKRSAKRFDRSRWSLDPGLWRRRAGGAGNSGSDVRVRTYCALCVSRCGAVATVERGTLVALDPDPTHPTGAALCLKGRVAPELVSNPDRLTEPLRRTRPKGDPDPGWEPISWDDALDTVAGELRRLAADHGPESVVFSTASPSSSAVSDATVWIDRLRNAFGSPNHCASMELGSWARRLAGFYTFGASVPGRYRPDLDRTGCILLWGYNPSVSRLAHANAIADAVRRGARLVVVDPRPVGLARGADHWLAVRPGTDGALALGLAHVLLANGWFDRYFVRRWTNGPLLVRDDDGTLLRVGDLGPRHARTADASHYLTWVDGTGIVPFDPDGGGELDRSASLYGTFEVATDRGPVRCRPVFQRVADLCGRYTPEHVRRLTGVPGESVIETARTLWEARPTSFQTWSGIEQQSGATQIARAIHLLYALLGDLDAAGGNVAFAQPPLADLAGHELLPERQHDNTIGRTRRPLGPARFGHVNVGDLYDAALDADPYRARGLVSFGGNLLLAHADGDRGRRALGALDFHVHADLFLNPTAEFADIVLPVAGPFETEGLQAGFEISPEACSLVQLRRPLVERRGESRSDTEIVFALAPRLGLGGHFWGGDIDAALGERLAPTGLTLTELRDHPEGRRLELASRYRSFAARDQAGGVAGFDTPTRRVELYSETLLRAGHPALPDYEPPKLSAEARPDLASGYPLVLTCAKDVYYCQSQHRGIATLRRKAFDPFVQLHPDAAKARGIRSGDAVMVETPSGRMRAQARLDPDMAPDVVCGSHGWWQACEEIGAPGHPTTGDDSANYNRLVTHEAVDPVSGSVPLRAAMCEVRRLGREED